MNNLTLNTFNLEMRLESAIDPMAVLRFSASMYEHWYKNMTGYAEFELLEFDLTRYFLYSTSYTNSDLSHHIDELITN